MASMHSLTDDDYQRAFRYARSLGADRDLAYDLVQGAVTRGLASGRQDIDEPLAYLMTSVRNGFYSEVRRDKTAAWTQYEELDGVIATDLQPLEDMAVSRDALRRAWSSLSAVEREVLHLWAVEGYTVDEISQRTGTPRGTLLARLHRLRNRLAVSAGDSFGASL
ncbi:sigma-70 family RNA polymerase sigma factor [Thioalkalivibrio sp. XN8]|uniref:RNA polymerase sigma factor n=1 Tax=Thioalkalivibrio sp. XN8 TaxID=2712863 RepID=UPI0013ED7A96|nr:sigma-70 family RNA polymerase sigma factor [Thioalkalivibrio sp. XN8]NGP53122.1 sigma-70 family RNA polymerase sigma factor [Thioalkalivibrio sp. XN8]